MLASVSYIAGFFALGFTVLLALFRGGRLEKEVAVVVAVAWLASALAPLNGRVGPAWVLIGIDIALLLYLLYRAAFSRRWWPIFAAAFQLLIVATHFTFAARLQLEQWAYFTAYYLWSWGVLVCLAAGALTTPRPGSPPAASLRPPAGG
ncbi:MAG: hypothetical protein K0M78_13830 [Brevundimonas sp.]|nr:hypothetical protein [Brevundimonas sp.]